MLNAKPNEYLDFHRAISPRVQSSSIAASEPEKPSGREKRRRAQLIEQARAEIQKRLTAASAKRVAPSPAPRYDEVFLEGKARLDQMAGEPVRASQGEIEFDDSVWQSSQRRDPEFS